MGVNIKMNNGREYYLSKETIHELSQKIKKAENNNELVDLVNVQIDDETPRKYRVKIEAKHISALEESM